MNTLPSSIRRELNQSGLPWRLVPGKKHIKLWGSGSTCVYPPSQHQAMQGPRPSLAKHHGLRAPRYTICPDRV